MLLFDSCCDGARGQQDLAGGMRDVSDPGYGERRLADCCAASDVSALQECGRPKKAGDEFFRGLSVVCGVEYTELYVRGAGGLDSICRHPRGAFRPRHSCRSGRGIGVL